MNKETDERAKLEEILFQTEDVIMVSGYDEYEDDIVNQNGSITISPIRK